MQKNPHFHGDCNLEQNNIEVVAKSSGNHTNNIASFRCKEHGVIVCHCGWEFGHHGEKVHLLERAKSKV